MSEEAKKEVTPAAAAAAGEGEQPKLSKNQLKKLAKGKVRTFGDDIWAATTESNYQCCLLLNY